MEAQTPAVAFDAVTKVYPDGTRALAGVTLDVARGSFVALVGASGSGKSTLLKTVNRLVVPTAGIVRVDGAAVGDGPAPALRRRIGYVFQGIGLFPHLSVAENIAIPLRAAGRRDPGRVAELLELVALDPALAARMPGELSGGQRQRVGVARALAVAPALMLMDEPFGALDPVTRDALGRELRALHDRLGLTTILVTHDMAEALLLADRVLVMAAGGEAAQALVAVPREQAQRLAMLA